MHFSIDYDQFPDLSWLEQDEFKGENPMDYVVLDMIAYDESGEVVDSLGGISFLDKEDDWTTGYFHSVEEIPARFTHLREIAQEMQDTAAAVETRRYLDLL